jgi:hypothetical protein
MYALPGGKAQTGGRHAPCIDEAWLALAQCGCEALEGRFDCA